MELKAESMMLTMSNFDDENRAYTVRGDVRVDDGAFGGIGNGRVYDSGNAEGVAYFSTESDAAMSVSFQSGGITDAQRLAVFGEIQDFVASAKAYVANNG